MEFAEAKSAATERIGWPQSCFQFDLCPELARQMAPGGFLFLKEKPSRPERI